MQLKSLYLRGFRNYKEAYIPFAPGINVIQGANAQGKTNLLEAIYLLVTGRSFRQAPLLELVHFEASSFYIEAHIEKNGVEETLKISSDGTDRKIFYNATSLPTLSTLLGILLGVILSPEDDALIRGQPRSRRQFLDLQIAEASPLYLHHLSRYGRAMKQRNLLLKQKDISQIDIWEMEMARSAAFLTRERKIVIADLSHKSNHFQDLLSDKHDQIALHYKTSAHQDPLEDYFCHQYKKHRPREMMLGITLTGPHKDDMDILLGGMAAKSFSSEGQMRSTAAALRLAEWTRLEEITEEKPLFCIDDMAISLDKARERLLFEAMGALSQVFITTPYFDTHLLHGAHVLRAEAGSIFF